MNTSHCPCESLPDEELPSDYPRVASEFEALRGDCQAIRELLVPDPDWPAFKNYMLQGADELHHRPAVMLAFMRRYLAQITSPVHRYLFHDGSLHPLLTLQYKQDLRERWMRESCLKEKHRKFNMFMGKMVELQCIDWLEKKLGWQMTNLNALGGPADISALVRTNTACDLEIKYVGQTLEGIIMTLKGAGEYEAAKRLQEFVDPETNHLRNVLNRMEYAISQLANSSAYRIAVVVFAEIAWRDFTHIFGGGEWEPHLRDYISQPDARVDEKWVLIGGNGMSFKATLGPENSIIDFKT